MKATLTRKIVFCILFVLCSGYVYSQSFNSPTVVIPTGGQTCIPLTVSGLPNSLFNYQTPNAFPVLLYVEINIQTTHPWTLHITLVSPQGTSLVLSSLNGFGGGNNYTGTSFVNPPGSNINTAMPPFTGFYEPEGLPGLSVFDGQNPNGTWFICVNDTMTDTTAVGGGPPGFGATSSGSGTMGFGGGGGGGGGGSGCAGMMSAGTATLCPGDFVNVAWTFGLPGWTYSPASVNIPGTYSITGTDPWGCQDIGTLTVYDDGIDLGYDATAYVCSGQSVNLGLYFNSSLWNVFSYSAWLNGAPVSSNTIWNASVPGQYIIEGYSFTGCTDQVEITLIQFPGPQLGPDQTVDLCPGDQTDLTQFVNLTGLTQIDWTYNGSPIGSSSVTAATQPGLYQVIGVNSNGCEDTAIVTLNNVAAPQLGSDLQMDVCQNATLDLTTLYNTSGLTASWTFNNQPVNNPTAVNMAGNYTLIATNSTGCPDTAEVLIANLPSPNIGPDQQSDFCQNTFVNLTGFFNTTGLTSAWTQSSIAVNNPSAVNSQGIYQLVATDMNGCADTALVNLTALPAPALGTDQTLNLCPGETTDLSTIFNTTGLTSNWTLGGIPAGNVNSISVPGIYQLVATNIEGCSDTALVTINAVAAPTLGPNQSLTGCQGDVFDLTTLFNTGSNNVQWTYSGSTVNNPSAVSQAGSYQIRVTNSYGCTNSATASIQLFAKPELGNDSNISFCSNDPYDLTGLYNLTGLTAQWTLNGTTVGDPQSISAGGNYLLVVTDANGCKDTSMVGAQMNQAPDLGPDLSLTLCPWTTVDLNTVFNTTGLITTWTHNGQVVVNPGPVHDAGLFEVSVIDPNGCTDGAELVLDTVFCECEADFVFQGKCIQEPVIFTLLADSAVISAHWSFSHPLMIDRNDINPAVLFYSEEPVQVILEAELSCGTKLVQKNIAFEDCSEPCPVYIPSAFTPNGDGKNELFSGITDCSPLEFELQIISRFGQIVFVAENVNQSWNGKFNETPSPEGLYVYRLDYKMPYQKKVVKTGTIALIR